MESNKLGTRRQFMKATALTGCAVVISKAVAQTATTTAGIVHKGDILVYQAGSKAQQPIKPIDIKVGTPVLAFAMDPVTKKLRDKVKGNIVVVKLKAADIKESSKPSAADGIVAYSAICTHQGCPVSKLGSMGAAAGQLECPCHHSLFDPADNGKVLGGPAPRRLPALPLKLEGKGIQLVATGDFISRVGPGK